MFSQSVIDGMLKEIAFALIKADVNIKVYDSAAIASLHTP